MALESGSSEGHTTEQGFSQPEELGVTPSGCLGAGKEMG